MRNLAKTLLIAAMSSTPALAQTTIWNAKEGLFRAPASAEDPPPPEGWQRSADLKANISLTSSEDVVGQTNGTSQTYGANLKGSLYHLIERHEWRNEAFLRESTTKTPNLPRFVKSEDELKLSTIFLYFLPSNPKLGPYARAEAAAPIFKGEDVRPEAKTYRIKRLDGSETTQAGTSLRLTDPWKPLTTKEAVGMFYRPIYNEKLHIETRLGFAAQQIAASGQYAQKGENKAGEVQIEELKDVSQAGLEAGLSIKGKIDEKSSYELGADSLTPFVNDKPSGDKRDAWRLTNVDAYVKLTSKLTEWASFGYDYKMKIQPQLVDRTQQIHMIVITLAYPVKPEKL